MFANLLIILASSLVVIALFRRLRLPPVLGYLCVGLAVGPTALDWVNDSEELPDLAELGVVFLLFSLGLEFSCRKCSNCVGSCSASAACKCCARERFWRDCWHWVARL